MVSHPLAGKARLYYIVVVTRSQESLWKCVKLLRPRLGTCIISCFLSSVIQTKRPGQDIDSHLLMGGAAKNCGKFCSRPQVSPVLLLALRICFQAFEVHQVIVKGKSEKNPSVGEL